MNDSIFDLAAGKHVDLPANWINTDGSRQGTVTRTDGKYRAVLVGKSGRWLLQVRKRNRWFNASNGKGGSGRFKYVLRAIALARP